MVATSSVVSVRQVLGAGLGSSSVAAAIGISPWKPPIVEWLEQTGQAPRQEGNFKTTWGQKLEPVVRSEYVERHGVEVHIPRVSEFHPTHQWCRATVDGRVCRLAETDTGEIVQVYSHILEVKCVGWRLAHAWGEEGERTIPDYYVCQAVWQMMVTGLPRVDFAVLLAGQEYFEVTLERDPELEADIFEAASEFWHRVQTRTPPDVDGSDAHTKYLKERLAKKSGIVQATPQIEALVQAWRDDEIELKRIGNRRDLRRNLVLAQMADLGATKVMTASNGSIALGEPGSKRDWKALVNHYATRLQLAGIPANVDEDVKPFTTPEDTGTLRRSPTWTKDA